MLRTLAFVTVCLFAPTPALAEPAAVQIPDFSYQGRLERNGQLVDGSANLVFTLWDAPSGGNQIGSAITENAYPVVGGLFTINLAFPGAFAGEQRYLEVSVDGTVLPRQPVATAPVAQYALTGSPGPQGPAGTTGQSATTVYGTGQLALTAGAGYTLIPGLTHTLNVPADAIVYLATDGGAQHTQTGTTNSLLDVAIFVDGVVVPSAGQRRLVLSNTPAVAQVIGNWSMSLTRTLSAGTHTITVRASNPGSYTVNVSSGSAPQIQGQLSVLVLKQ